MGHLLLYGVGMNEAMKQAWLEISQMLGEPTREELDVFLRTWQRAAQATREALAEQPAQRTWVGLSDAEIHNMTILMGFNPEWVPEVEMVKSIVRNLEAKLKEKNT